MCQLLCAWVYTCVCVCVCVYIYVCVCVCMLYTQSSMVQKMSYNLLHTAQANLVKMGMDSEGRGEAIPFTAARYQEATCSDSAPAHL